ncbi:hypothetical protein PT974_02069 [Cladobotryum mycophilum]|uniref:Uncharacterized protein n=1 Tax=Cladobotryum mycophilum TaxID=491253 RepID=A0ABR0SXD8_9HYPO
MAAATMAQDAQQMPFIKNLASSDRKLRTASLSSLQAFLASRRDIPPRRTQALDGPQALAADLANLLFGLQPSCAGAWLAGFWSVLGTQWPHIEALRLDKFLLLVRRVFAAQVRWARERGFSGQGSEVVLQVLQEWCFDAEDEHKVALGLRLHVLDVWVDELERESALGGPEEEEEASPEAKAFVKSIGDMVEKLKRCPVKSVRQRAQDSHEDERLPWVEAKGDDDDDDAMEEEDGQDADSDDEWGGIDN